MNAIVVVDNQWAIGKDGGLLIHLSNDLKYFKDKTKDNVIVIGRKTLESFPGGRPLPSREHVIITRQRNYEKEGCLVLPSIEDAVDYIGGISEKEVFIAGGEEIYAQFMPYVDTIYVTKIYADLDGDKHFENLDENNEFEKTWQGENIEENGVRYQFEKYERR